MQCENKNLIKINKILSGAGTAANETAQNKILRNFFRLTFTIWLFLCTLSLRILIWFCCCFYYHCFWYCFIVKVVACVTDVCVHRCKSNLFFCFLWFSIIIQKFLLFSSSLPSVFKNKCILISKILIVKEFKKKKLNLRLILLENFF